MKPLRSLEDGEERIQAMAPVMYRILKKIEALEVELSEVLSAIESEEDREESE